MAKKLEDFHLESYEERSVLIYALTRFREVLDRHPEYKDAVNALLLRVSRTECQPGGCSYCYDDETAKALDVVERDFR